MTYASDEPPVSDAPHRTHISPAYTLEVSNIVIPLGMIPVTRPLGTPALQLDGLATSPSAIAVVVKDKILKVLLEALPTTRRLRPASKAEEVTPFVTVPMTLLPPDRPSVIAPVVPNDPSPKVTAPARVMAGDNLFQDVLVTM